MLSKQSKRSNSSSLLNLHLFMITSRDKSPTFFKYQNTFWVGVLFESITVYSAILKYAYISKFLKSKICHNVYYELQLKYS
jgi:hypothetical protein